MEKIYGYVNSVNLLSSLSLVLLWMNALLVWNLLSEAIVNNYVALTAVYAPALLFVLQVGVMLAMALFKKPIEYYHRTAALFSFVNMAVYLLFLLYEKYA